MMSSPSSKNTSNSPMNFYTVSTFNFEQIWSFCIKNEMISIDYTPSPTNILEEYAEEENSFIAELEEIELPRNEWVYFTRTLKINGEFISRTYGYMMAVADNEDIDELKFRDRQ